MRPHLGVSVLILCALSMAWLTDCSHHGEKDGGEDAMRGRELFAIHCAPCHQATGLELHQQPPKLEGLFRSKTLPSGAPATDAQVRKTIIEGRGTMPAFEGRLNEREVEELVRYLHTLK